METAAEKEINVYFISRSWSPYHMGTLLMDMYLESAAGNLRLGRTMSGICIEDSNSVNITLTYVVFVSNV